MKLSTSTRISLGFSLLSIVILGLFSVSIYGLFNRGWQRSEQQFVRTDPRIVESEQGLIDMGQKNDLKGVQGKKMPKMYEINQSLHPTDPLFIYIQTLSEKNGQITYENTHYFYTKKRDTIVVREITQHITKQQELLKLLLFGMLGGVLISFFLGRIFVKWALRDLHLLTKKIEQLDIDSLSFGHELDHLPSEDEIRTLASTLNRMTISLQAQIDDMKLFVANAAHELRTPLMIMRSSAELATKTNSYEEQLPIITKTIGQMDGLVSTLLTLAQVNKNFILQETNPLEVILPVIDQMKQKRSTKNISLSLATTAVKNIQAHAGALERIYHNILDNACKYTPENGTIAVSLYEDGCMIKDSGNGISEEDMEKIYTPFWQADASKGTDAGFGLGLALVKRLVDVHGRSIQITADDTGTTVTIER